MENKVFNAMVDMGYDSISAYVNNRGLVEYLSALRGEDHFGTQYDGWSRDRLLMAIQWEIETRPPRKITVEDIEKRIKLPKGLARNKVKVYYNGKLTTWGKLRPLTFKETMSALWYDVKFCFSRKRHNKTKSKVI